MTYPTLEETQPVTTTPPNVDQLWAAAQRRYHLDPAFHARADLAEKLAVQLQTGRRTTAYGPPTDRALARAAAVIALHLADQDPTAAVPPAPPAPRPEVSRQRHTVELPPPPRDGSQVAGSCSCGWVILFRWGVQGQAADRAHAHIVEAARAQPIDASDYSGTITVTEGPSL